MQFIKFGFGRCSRDCSRFIQNGHLSRKKAIEHVKNYDGEFPKKNLAEVLEFLHLKKSEFLDIIDKHRNEEIWYKNNKKKWQLYSTVYK